MHVLQVRREGFVSVNDCVRRYVFLAVCLPQRAQLGPHVAALRVRVFVARRHLLDGVDVDVDVRRRVWRVEDLAEGQDKAASGVLGKEKDSTEKKKKTANPQVMLKLGWFYFGICEGMCVLS